MEFATFANRIGIPTDDALRSIALDDAALSTPAMTAFQEVGAYRPEVVHGGRHGCLRVVGGPARTGKSAAAAHFVVRLGRDLSSVGSNPRSTAVFASAREIEMDMAVAHGDCPPDEESTSAKLWKDSKSRLDDYENTHVLVIDNMGAEPWRNRVQEPYTSSPLISLIETRLDNGRRTLVTTRLSHREFVERYMAGRVESRLFNQGTHLDCTPVKGEQRDKHLGDMRYSNAEERASGSNNQWLPWFVSVTHEVVARTFDPMEWQEDNIPAYFPEEVGNSHEISSPSGVQIDLKDPKQFTLASVRRMIALGNDNCHNQIRVTKDGIAYLSHDLVGNEGIEHLLFRFETFSAGNGYVGRDAAADRAHVEEVYNDLKENWPNPRDSLLDH